MPVEGFDLIFNSKLKKEIMAALSATMKLRKPETVKLLFMLFARKGNRLLGIGDLEAPFRDLVEVKSNLPIPSVQLLEQLFSKALYPLLLKLLVPGDLLKTLCNVLAKTIVENKLTFSKLLDCMNN